MLKYLLTLRMKVLWLHNVKTECAKSLVFQRLASHKQFVTGPEPSGHTKFHHLFNFVVS